MWEYTKSFLNPFAWAKTAYTHLLSNNQLQEQTVTELELVEPVVDQVITTLPDIQTAADWNINTNAIISNVAGVYKSVDQASTYLNSLYNNLNTRLAESDGKLKEALDQIRAIRSNIGLSSTTNITLKGGNSTAIDYNPDLYQDIDSLEASSTESLFRLKDTGHFSSIRSLGGFAGRVSISRQLGYLVETGARTNMTDGSTSSFWSGTHYAPSLLKATNSDIPWLPNNYQHGYALEITYDLDRPTLVSELFIDPVSTEPFDLVSIAYTPKGVTNCLNNPTFDSGLDWVTTNATVVPDIGVGNSDGVLVVAPSGYISQTFDILTAMTRTLNGVTVEPVPDDVVGSRVELTFAMRGAGNSYGGARLVWLDNTGSIINYTKYTEFPTAFFKNLKVVDFIPALAVSGRVDLGVFDQPLTTATIVSSAIFDNANLFVGEQRQYFNQSINGPTTIPIKNRQGAVVSKRFSFVFAQRNPRRERIARTIPTTDVSIVSDNLYIDNTLQQGAKDYIDSFYTTGDGNSAFAYRLGFKELDLRLREFLPRGIMYTYPLKTGTEIRKAWVTSEFNKWNSDGVNFYFYPYKDDSTQFAQLDPWLVGALNQTEGTGSIGDILQIFTTEEISAGWNQNSTVQLLELNPKPILESFDGTDFDGKLTLTKALHTRKVKIAKVTEWLDNYSVYPPVYDPNAENIQGIANETYRSAIRAADSNTLEIPTSELITSEGYLPIKVTIKTDNWTAYPDTFGKPQKGVVGGAVGELLTSTQVQSVITNTTEEYIGFSTWLNNTTALTFANSTTDTVLRASINRITKNQLTDLSLNGYLSLLNGSERNSNTNRLQTIYTKLKADKNLPKELNQVTTDTASVSKDQAYKTKFAPIITGSNGSLFNLFWFDPVDIKYHAVPRNQYVINPNIGLVVLLTNPPSSGFTTLVANYKYIYQNGTEDFSGGLYSYLTQVSESIAESDSILGSNARVYPITRNMTDFVNGKVPELKPPNFDEQSKNWYPVIEYYITPNNEIYFSRDFFKYGDLPGKIEVEYSSLDIEPRLAVEVIRGGAPTASANIHSVTMFVKETASVPTKEIS